MAPPNRTIHSFMLVFGVALLACGGSADQGAADAAAKHARADAATPAQSTNSHGVRLCAYVPGKSKPVVLGADVRPARKTMPASPALPAPSAVPVDTTQRQLGVFSALRQAVIDNYHDPAYNGNDWNAITDRYRALVEGGLSDTDFYALLEGMVRELGDDHSYYQSPSEAADADATSTKGQNFVGIGILATPIGDGTQGAVIAVWPDSPAANAGLLRHDLLLEVDGQPYRGADRIARSLGPEGTSFELTYQRPGQGRKTVTLTRRAVQGFIPVDYCLVPDTHIGYVLLPTFLDKSIDDQVRDAVKAMSAGGALDGLIVDNRMNDGGSGQVMQATLELFLDGRQGRFVSRTAERSLGLTGMDLDGSQSVPLVVLTESDTASFAEVFSGVLQLAGRAKLVGGTTRGNVETLQRFVFDDGSRAWLATETFAPTGLDPGAWEGRGVAPDVDVPSRWDLFTEATDPVLARAVDLLR